MANRVQVEVPCEDCGQKFPSPFYQGVRMARYCGPCRDARNRAFELNRQEVHRRSVAFHREQWLSDPQRGVPLLYRGLDWEDFHFDLGGERNRSRVAALRQWAQEMPMEGPPVGYKSLLLASEHNGVGKTMLASLILKEIVNRFDDPAPEHCPYQFWSMGDVRLRLRAANRYQSSENEAEVYRDFGTMRLLILDDVGKEQLTGAE